jgi:hypothetical protein
MKIILIVAAALALAACQEDKVKTAGMIDLTDSIYVQLKCYDGIKYIYYDRSLTAKINESTRLPERCTE